MNRRESLKQRYPHTGSARVRTSRPLGEGEGEGEGVFKRGRRVPGSTYWEIGRLVGDSDMVCAYMFIISPQLIPGAGFGGVGHADGTRT